MGKVLLIKFPFRWFHQFGKRNKRSIRHNGRLTNMLHQLLRFDEISLRPSFLCWEDKVCCAFFQTSFSMFTDAKPFNWFDGSFKEVYSSPRSTRCKWVSQLKSFVYLKAAQFINIRSQVFYFQPYYSIQSFWMIQSANCNTFNYSSLGTLQFFSNSDHDQQHRPADEFKTFDSYSTRGKWNEIKSFLF